MAECYLGLGSNLGDRRAALLHAVAFLQEEPEVYVEKISSFFETDPQGGLAQGKFINQVIKVKTGLSPHQLLEVIQRIEKKLGRVRIYKDGPRTVDIDILLYDQLQLSEKGLCIPHPRMCDRLFVIEPLLEIEPDIFERLEIIKPYKDKITRLLRGF